MRIQDRDERILALEPFQSFAVSAPAGSGKTELLTQRVLRLLSVVENPEEILCMTFANKAADEMKSRVIEYLIRASKSDDQNTYLSLQKHEVIALDLAKKALSRNKAKKWNLLDNPSRLRIYTIDGFCRKLAGQLPLESEFNPFTKDLPEPITLYKKVVSELILSQIERNNDISKAISTLLGLLDNDLNELQNLLVNLLQDRGQSIAHLYQTDKARDYFEGSLNEVIEETLLSIKSIFDPFKGELLELVKYATTNLLLQDEPKNTDLLSCSSLEDLPSPTSSGYKQWTGLLSMFFTEKKEWRKKLTLHQGFPATDDSIDNKKDATKHAKQKKEDMGYLIEKLQGEAGAYKALRELTSLPVPHYSDLQWQTIKALKSILLDLSGLLSITLKQNKACDYTEVSFAALRSLGTEDAPTELAFKQDYTTKHILVDEFQDTSSLQFKLIKNLTREWQPEDNRSLFIVGDPMQCLYSWRGANVRQFMQVRENPIGNINLRKIDLMVNFRSTAKIVDWVNSVFQCAFDDKDDLGRGSVSYSPSVACSEDTCLKNDKSEKVITLDEFIDYKGSNDAEKAEAKHIASLVCKTKKFNPQGSIAILANTRKVLPEILIALKNEGVSWQATEIDPLNHRMSIIDLKSLTKALLSPADRISWLAILRSPWCGLNLHDLFLVTNYKAKSEDDSSSTEPPLIITNIFRYTEIKDISTDGKQILSRCCAVLKSGWKQRYKKPLRVWIESIWIELGGPNSLTSEQELNCCQQYFDLLELHENSSRITDWSIFEKALEGLYVAPNETSDPNVFIMTIHKAKGLEFDTVIIPGLNRPDRNNSKEPLIRWHERTNKKGEDRLIAGPRPETGQENNRIFDYLKQENKLREELERIRKAYVAVTRAKKRLHLTYTVSIGENIKQTDEMKPSKSTLLTALFGRDCYKERLKNHPFLSCKSYDFRSVANDNSNDRNSQKLLVALNRLPASWEKTLSFNKTKIPKSIANIVTSDEKKTSSIIATSARHTGTVLHRILNQIVIDGIHKWDERKIIDQTPHWQSQLQGLGLTNYDQPLSLLQRSVDACIRDKKNHWIFDSSHKDSKCEYRIGYKSLKGKQSKTSVIDRCFILNGTQWIIDYKSSEPSKDQSRDVFLNQEVAEYEKKLRHYEKILHDMNNLPTKTGLYFPLIQHLEIV